VSENPIPMSALLRALALRDLTDPAQGPHAMQLVVRRAIDALATAWGCPVRTIRASPVVRAEDNYDRLRYPLGAAARDARYTRWIGPGVLLRTHTSALIPSALDEVAQDPPADQLLACPGIVYRRDSIDRMHTGEPHQVDLWRIRAGRLTRADLDEMIAIVVAATLPGASYRTAPAVHPYTADGRQIDVRVGDEWVEIGECGLAHPDLLASAGLPSARWAGLAMGLGLDRIVMLQKGIDDIRLLRSTDERVCAQMLDLSPYRPVSRHPAIRRDLSIAVATGTTVEELGDRVRGALGTRASDVETVEVVAATSYGALPPAAVARLGIAPSQTNVLLRVVLRSLDRALTHREANALRDDIYAAVHEGSRSEWATSGTRGD
jgi:phenylalanyl-tRNA synthetase alpha chain